MMKWIMRRWHQVFGDEAPTPNPSDSKRFLSDLRQNELSVVATMRRGESVNTAPRQLLSATTRSQRPHGGRATAAATPPVCLHTAAASSTPMPCGDLATTLVIGAAAISIAGGLVEAALSAAEEAAATPAGDPQN